VELFRFSPEFISDIYLNLGIRALLVVTLCPGLSDFRHLKGTR